MHTEEKYLRELYEKIKYDPDLFNIYFHDHHVIVTAKTSNASNPINQFFMYKTLYDTIIDIDKKTKKSFSHALKWEYKSDTTKFSMISSPTKEENEAIYYTENAMFRTSILWDLLAQLYNVRYNGNNNPEKVHYGRLFDCESHRNNPNPIATKIHEYLTEKDDTDGAYNEFWSGNHKYVKKYRNKLSHRNSPNVFTISNYDIQCRMPMRYVLKRLIEDYVRVSEFINSMLEEIMIEYDGDFIEKLIPVDEN